MTNDNKIFLEQVGIQVFAASLFSYFISNTLNWLSEHHTSKMYDIQIFPLTTQSISDVMKIFLPVAFIIVLDIFVFIFFMYRFWIKMRTQPIGSFWDAISQIMLILPISSFPWAVFHLFTPFLGDNKFQMHITFFLSWVVLCGISTFFYLIAYKPKYMPWRSLLKISKHGQEYRGDYFGAFLAFLVSVFVALQVKTTGTENIEFFQRPLFYVPFSGLIFVFIILILSRKSVYLGLQKKFLRKVFSDTKIQIFNGYVRDEAVETKTFLSWTEYWETDWQEIMGDYPNKLINSSNIDEDYCVLINPFGENYPEENEPNLTTLNNILHFVSKGGIFINAAGFPFFYSYNTTFLPAPRITGDIEIYYQRDPPNTGAIMTPAINPSYASVRHSWLYKNLKIKNNLFGVSDKPVFPVEDEYFRDLVPALGQTSVREFRSVVRSDDPEREIVPIVKSYSVFTLLRDGLTVNTQYPCYPIAAIKYGYGYFVFIGMQLVKSRPQDFELVRQSIMRIIQKVEEKGFV